MYSGMISLPWWGYVVVSLILTHITIAAVTIYLHRHSAHRALDLNPVVSHVFRFWLWLTTGMRTKAWTSIHRKHHARCETNEDPHSPQTLGIQRVMWKGAELYKAEARNQETLERFGQGTPDDWIERNVYSPHSVLGIATMLVIDVVLFGPIGLTIWAVQMVWIPLFAAGVINGVGHYWGYRSFQADDASRNIVPWGILIGGEELHNNHHAYPTSARFSSKWWELDIGWFYIRVLELLGLAKVKKRLPRVSLAATTSSCDERTLHAVLITRYDILAKFSRSMKDTCLQELIKLKSRNVRHDRRVIKRWLDNEEHRLATFERERLHEVLGRSTTLSTLNSMRRELAGLWRRSSMTKGELIVLLEDWCQRAERSGIAALQEFSHRLRRFQIAAT